MRIPATFFADSSQNVYLAPYGIPGNSSASSYFLMINILLSAIRAGKRLEKTKFARLIKRLLRRRRRKKRRKLIRLKSKRIKRRKRNKAIILSNRRVNYANRALTYFKLKRPKSSIFQTKFGVFLSRFNLTLLFHHKSIDYDIRETIWQKFYDINKPTNRMLWKKTVKRKLLLRNIEVLSLQKAKKKISLLTKLRKRIRNRKRLIKKLAMIKLLLD